MRQLELDEWDIRIIRYLKRTENPTLAGVMDIYAERCGMEVRYIGTQHLAMYLLNIVDTLKLANVSILVQGAHPDRLWQYGGYGVDVTAGTVDEYWFGWFVQLCSILRNTDVARLPGYHDPDFTHST